MCPRGENNGGDKCNGVWGGKYPPGIIEFALEGKILEGISAVVSGGENTHRG